ncbi:virus attachment protein p12 family protein [Clostridium ragsdalei P11]|uniref:Virus attachment protein p12 family protein n=1 Tax=Clostridium ragsdalei P11 TaxID=1353534 RepID=A0A1A6AM86_9CLOT|nr:FeoB-associated Cys-rich membrane protein [Clostridium ragsdalei]OBR91184.1 virus attachment protein p12 family protein [Clostridium ragsdalei P11]
MLEIIVTIIIAGTALYILYRNIKNKAKGKCDCGCCTGSKCPYNTKDCNNIKKF